MKREQTMKRLFSILLSFMLLGSSLAFAADARTQERKLRSRAVTRAEEISVDPVMVAFQAAGVALAELLCHLNTKPAQKKADLLVLFGLTCEEAKDFQVARDDLRRALTSAFGEFGLSSLDESPRDPKAPSLSLKEIGKAPPKEDFDLELLKQKYEEATVSLEKVILDFNSDERAFIQTRAGQLFTDANGHEYFQMGLCDEDRLVRSIRFNELSEKISAYFMHINALYHIVEEQKRSVLSKNSPQ